MHSSRKIFPGLGLTGLGVGRYNAGVAVGDGPRDTITMKPTLQRVVIRVIRQPAVALCLVLFASASRAQLIPKQTNPFPGQSSDAAQGCSLQKSCAELAPGMIQSALGASPLGENLRHLATVIGGRMTGTTANEKAVAWAVSAFRAAGISNVKAESFTLPMGWNEGATVARVVAPEKFELRLVSTGWSPPISPSSGITTSLVDVGAGDNAGFANAGDAARGAIVFVRQGEISSVDDLLSEYTRAPSIIDRAVEAHAAAIFWMSTRPGDLLYRHTSTPSGGVLEKIPQAIVARDDAEKIAQLLAAGEPVRVHFEMPNKLTGPVQVKNVVAEIRGWDKPDEFVVLGAHLDSWDIGQGALDNGCDDAMVIDVARVIHSSGSLPRRSIRFVLFNGEEQGFLGSRAYVKAHRAELDRAIAAIVFDSGSGKVSGYSVAGREDMLPDVREALDPLKTLGVTNFTDDAAIETDNFDFLLEGVPTLLPNQEFSNYLPNYDASSDTFEKVDIANLKKQTAIAAITAYAIADNSVRIGPRQSRAEIDQLLKETGLDQQMKLEGFWDEWQSGERGRQP
jgi:carboxypeptidase Q